MTVIRLKILTRDTLRLRVLPRLPVSAQGANGISASVTNGIMTIEPSWEDLALVTSLDNPEDKELWVRDPDTGVYNRVSIQSIVNIIGALGTPRIITGSTDIASPNDTALIVNRASPTTTGISLPSVTGRNGVPLSIIDYSTGITDPTGHTITITPDGSEKIMRQSTWTLFSNSASLASVRLHPVESLLAWVIAP